MLFRRVNERTRGLLWVADDVPCWFGCECGASHCSGTVPLTTSEYDAIRTHAARFIVCPGHDDPASEDVVEEKSGYAVVEKRGAELAIALWRDLEH